jgi:uncharacterized membrane protein
MRKVDASVALFAGVSILYPIIAAVAVRYFGPGWVLLGLLALLALRGTLGLTRKLPGGLTYGLLFVAAALALVALYDRELSVRLYPAFVNAAMLVAFGHSLLRPPSMIERFARIVEPDLPESGVRYTRAVTWIWVGFFVINGSIAVWTALYADWNTWALYNGLVAYIAMGALFGGEMLLRPFFRRAKEGQ